jgi:hypothetical protein
MSFEVVLAVTSILVSVLAALAARAQNSDSAKK